MICIGYNPSLALSNFRAMSSNLSIVKRYFLFGSEVFTRQADTGLLLSFSQKVPHKIYCLCVLCLTS